MRVEDVARRAGVAVSLLYYHFDSRAGLLEATMDYTNETSASATLAGQREDGSEYSRLEEALLGELEGSRSWRKTCLVWNELTASAMFDEKLRKQVDQVLQKWTKTVAGFIQAGTADGSIRRGVDPQLEAELVTSLTDGLVSRWLSKSLSRQRAREILVSALRDRLRADALDGMARLRRSPRGPSRTKA